MSVQIIREARAGLYRLHWRVRSRVAPFDLHGTLALLEETQYWTRSRLDDLRSQKLRTLVASLYERSPRYRIMLDEVGAHPRDIRGIEDLTKLPIMTKAMLREHGAALRARNFRDDTLETGITGGTTGMPMQVVRDYAGTIWMRASYWRGLGWGGLGLGTPWAQLFGGSLGRQTRPLAQLKSWFAGKVFLPAFELGPGNVAAYAAAVKRAGARFLVGYCSACHQLAALAESAGIALHLDAVFPTAELLPEHWRERIARVFGAKVLPYYGCGEVQSLAYTCPDRPDVYHTCDEHAVIEVEQEDGRAALTGEGAFLITDLDNQAMPLIRYRNGDAGVLAGPGCECGRSLRRITRLDGRVNDVLLTTTGNVISGVIGTHAFRHVPGVVEYQIVQHRPGQAVIRIVRTPGYEVARAEPALHAIFRKHLGEGADVSIEYHGALPRTAAGKARFVINEYLASTPERAFTAR